jgi:GTP cyclohydrolase I
MDIEKIKQGVRLILEGIGEDLGREGLRETPERVARMYAELFSGVGRDPLDAIRPTVFSENHDEMVILKDIPFYSMCEHHLVPFYGKAHVAYIPGKDGKIVGLSKLARIVDATSRKPSLQERLTTEIADALERLLDPLGVLVIIEAEHLCMSMRGVSKPGHLTVTSAVRGVFRTSQKTREEALSLLHP